MSELIKDNNKVKQSVTVLTIIFMMWGFITVANGALLKQLEGAIEMTKIQSRLLKYVFFLVYFVMAMPAAKIVEKVGYKKGVIYGLILSACCSVFMVLAARELEYFYILTGIIVLASGVTLLQVAANPYVMLLAGKGKEASYLTKVQAFNSIGGWLAPLIWVMVLAYEPHIGIGTLTDDMHRQLLMEATERVVLPYILFSVILAGLTIRLNFSSLKDITVDNSENEELNKGDSVFKYKHVVMGAIAIFCYVAAEVAIGTNLGRYIKFGLNLNQFEGMENYLIAYFWGSAMVGRFVGGQLLEGKKEQKGVVLAASGALLLLLMSILNQGILSLTFILFIGLFNSILFPAIFALSVKNMGALKARASGLLNMAIIGGAIGALTVDQILDFFGGEGAIAFENMPAIKVALLFTVPCYLFVIYFGASGYKNKAKNKK